MSQRYFSREIIIAALKLQSSLVSADDIKLPDAELELKVIEDLISDLAKALKPLFYPEVIAIINVR